MNRNMKTVMIALAFAFVLGAAYFSYTSLASKYRPQTALPAASGSPAVSGGSSAVSAAPGGSSAASSKPASGPKAPDFTVYDEKGNEARLSDFKGTPVVLNFWASWCYWCKKEMPEFDRVYAQEKGNVRFLMVDWTDGQSETKQSGAAYVKGAGYSFPVYFDTKQSAVSAYGLTGIPATYFIDRDGNIAGGGEGAIDAQALKQGIEQIKVK